MASVSLVIESDGKVTKRFDLKPGANLIGRVDSIEELFPEVDLENYDVDAKVSRRHARVHLKDGGIFVEDLGSLNGTFVNGDQQLAKGERRELQNGDEIIVGKTVLRVEVA